MDAADLSRRVLYYTRYIRHDPYMVAGCLLLAIAVFRYLEVPERRWLITAFLSVAFLLTNHELVLATFLVMVAVLWGSLLLTYLRPLIPIHLITMVLLGVAAFLWLDEPFPPIPWQRPASSALTSSQFFEFVRYLGPALVALALVLIVISTVKSDILTAGVSGALVLAGVLWLYLGTDIIPEVANWQVIPETEGRIAFLTTSQFYWALLARIPLCKHFWLLPPSS